MHAHPLSRALPLGLTLLVVGGGCLDCDTGTGPEPGAPCVLEEAQRDRLEPFVSGVRVFLDVEEGEGADLLERDLRRYLSRLWGGEVEITRGAPEDEQLPTLFFTTSPDSVARAGGAPTHGYRMLRSGEGTTVTVAANELLALSHGAYAFLEELGARFFHPVDEIVPSLDAAYLPKELDVERAPAAPLVGLHLHLLHPLEYLRPFLEPGEKNLEDAKDVIDWLVKTGHTHLQWYMMHTVPWEPWLPHARAIVDYAHARGLTVGMVVQTLDDGSNLQNQFVLADPRGDLHAELEEGLDRIMEIPFDHVGLALGEFFAADPGVLIEALNHATAYLAETYIHDDLGYAAGIDTHPPRVPFEALLSMSEVQRKAFETDTVERLGVAAAEMRSSALEPLRDVCGRSRGALTEWCAELEDSVEIVALRLEHSRHLYRAVLAAVRGHDYEAELSAAHGTREEAAAVIARREQGYRYDLEELTGAYDNFTRYKFGYLRQPHTQCLWRRQEDQVAYLIENGEPASPFELRRCQD